MGINCHMEKQQHHTAQHCNNKTKKVYNISGMCKCWQSVGDVILVKLKVILNAHYCQGNPGVSFLWHAKATAGLNLKLGLRPGRGQGIQFLS